MVHGDQNGLRLPPAIAPTQVMCVVVRQGESALMETVNAVYEKMIASGIRCAVDSDINVPYGRRSIGHEINGIPIRLEFGPREFENGVATIIRRDTGAREECRFDDLIARCKVLLDTIQKQLFDEAHQLMRGSLENASSLDEAREIASQGRWAEIDFDLIRDAEKYGKLGSGLSTRNLHRSDGSLPLSTSESGLRAYVAKAY